MHYFKVAVLTIKTYEFYYLEWKKCLLFPDYLLKPG